MSAGEVYESLRSSDVPGVTKSNVAVTLQSLAKTTDRVTKVGDRTQGVSFVFSHK
jgi:hypothetical protein